MFEFDTLLGVLFAGVGLLAAYLCARGKQRWLLSLLAAVFFYGNLSLEVISAFEAWKLVAVMGAALVLARAARGEHLHLASGTPRQLLGFLLMYWLLAAAFGMVALSIDSPVGGHYVSFLHTDGRLITQAAYYAIVLTLFLVAATGVRSAEEAAGVLNWTYIAIVVLAALGVLQAIVWHFAHLNLFPINRAGLLDAAPALINSGGLIDVFRVNSLAGEPKHLGLAIAVGLAIHVAAWRAGYRLPPIRHVGPPVLLVALVLTYSTTGAVLAAVSLAYAWWRAMRSHPALSLLLLAGVTVSVATAVVSLPSSYQFVLLKTGLEEQDMAVLQAFSQHPILAFFGFGPGLIHRYAAEYVDPAFFFFLERPFKGNNGLLFVTADLGIVGFALLAAMCVTALRKARAGLTHEAPATRAALFTCYAAAMVFIIFALRYTEFAFLVLGLLFGVARTSRPSTGTAFPSHLSRHAS